MVTKRDLEREFRSKISTDAKSFEARYREECQVLRDEIVEVLECVIEKTDNLGRDMLETILCQVHDIALEIERTKTR